MSLSMLQRVENGLNPGGSEIYNRFLLYFDLVAQVHSIVLTKKGLIYLRVWFGDRIGPMKLKEKRNKSLFRVDQSSFLKYLCPPDRNIGLAVERIKPENCLLDINLFDEHIASVKDLKSGDYVAITNIHYALTRSVETFVLHGGTAYNRGVFPIPPLFYSDAFQRFRRLIEQLTQRLTYLQDAQFVEFVEEDGQEKEEEQDENAPILGETTNSMVCKNIVIGDLISVDRFRKTNSCKYQFLTHAHSDHYQGLNSSWTSKVYCSEETCRILPELTSQNGDGGINPNLLVPLKIGETHQIDNFQVTLLDANHCFGAAMLLFEGTPIPGGAILCTGDFRADSQFLSRFETEEAFKKLANTRISTIYLDNTYLSVDKEYPTRQDAARILMEKVVERGDNCDIIIPLHKLGRERLLEELSSHVQEPIQMYPKKEAIASLMNVNLKNGKINEKRTISVVERNKFTLKHHPENFALFDISMISNLLPSAQFQNVPKENYVHIPYSDHSSRNEILEFLKRLNFEKVIPISKNIENQDINLFSCQ